MGRKKFIMQSWEKSLLYGCVKQVMREHYRYDEPMEPRDYNSGSNLTNGASGVVGKCVNETGCGRLRISLWERLRGHDEERSAGPGDIV